MPCTYIVDEKDLQLELKQQNAKLLKDLCTATELLCEVYAHHPPQNGTGGFNWWVHHQEMDRIRTEKEAAERQAREQAIIENQIREVAKLERQIAKAEVAQDELIAKRDELRRRLAKKNIITGTGNI